jgi:ferric-dicitrate binding protein FerR (iron transport regulator)
MSGEKNHVDILRDELLHDVSDHDRTALDEWSRANDDNRDFRRLVGKMELSSPIEDHGSRMKSQILKAVNERIDRSMRLKHILRRAIAAASVAIMLGTTGYFSYREGFKHVNSQQIISYNPPGMLSTVVLPDGSKVILNAGTTISYPNVFTAGNREIEIEGEAFFEVVHDAGRPFTVNAGELDVEVLGTQFNVKAYMDDERIEVSLAQGKVGIRREGVNEQVVLAPGDQTCYDKSTRSLIKRSVNITHYTSWKNGVYYFRALPLKEIAKQLERIFDVRIHTASPEIGNIIITGDFVRSENLIHILRVITTDKRLKYKIEDDDIYIY